MNGGSSEQPTEFALRWGNVVATGLSQIAGTRWTTEPGGMKPPASGDKRVAVQFVLAKSLCGRMRISLAQEQALRLVSIFTGTEAAEEWNGEQQEALDELFRQFAGLMATALKPERGEVDFQLEGASDFNAVESACEMVLKDPQGVPLALRLEMNASLTAAIAGQRAQDPDFPAGKKSCNNLDLLMNVELEVTLRFGKCEMVLQDILDLQSGSVIELDREIHEPVDLLLDGRIVARGDVVVVDGNYGLRVSEVGTVTEQARG